MSGQAVAGRLGGMTTPRAPKSAARPGRPGERAMMAGLVLAVAAGVAWTAGMVYALMGWPL